MIKSKASIDWFIVVIVSILLLSGLAYLSSALVTNNSNNFLRDFPKQLAFVTIGIILATVIYKLDIEKLFSKKWLWMTLTALPLGLLGIFIAATKIASFFGLGNSDSIAVKWANAISIVTVENGAARWFEIGFVSIQPSEFAKPLLILFAASIFNEAKFVEGRDWVKPVFWIGLSLLLILSQPDLGNVVVISLALFGMAWIRGISRKVLVSVAIIGIALLLFSVFSSGYRNTRFQAFVYTNFCTEYDLNKLPPRNERKGVCSLVDFNISSTDFYQVTKVRDALHEGGLTGVGYNKGNLKNQIPFVETDGVIGVVGEESGLVMVLFLIILFLILFFRILNTAERIEDMRIKMLLTGIAVWLFTQTFWNLSGMTGLIPMKGLPLPLISKGGSSIVATLIAIGLVLNGSKYAGQKVVRQVKTRSKPTLTRPVHLSKKMRI
jgi:cell division protein FtsW (lipid II flippase)